MWIISQILKNKYSYFRDKVLYVEHKRNIGGKYQGKTPKKGLTQEKLAEKAGMSLQYLAMLELARKFPSGEMLERLANALDFVADGRCIIP